MTRLLGRSIVAGFLLALACASRLGAQTSYPIVCRGGPGIRVELDSWNPGVLYNGSMLFLHFNRGTSAAVQGVAPGTCAWQDRPVGANEPAFLCWDGIVLGHVSFDAGSGAVLEYGIATAGGEAQVRLGTRDGLVTRPYYRPGDPSQLMYFRAVNQQVDRWQCLHVTHTGP